MKKVIKIQILSLLFVFLNVQTSFSQSVLIADNKPSAPTGAHVFATLQEAIDAATPGDIIHVLPSPTNYGTVTINKSITLFGIGFKPDKDGPEVTTLNFIHLNAGASDVRISGINVKEEIVLASAGGTYNLNNIFIENGEIDVIRKSNSTGARLVSNVFIRNCIIGNRELSSLAVIEFDIQDVSSVIITNNIIAGTTSTASGGVGSLKMSDATIKNNLFLGDGSSFQKVFDDVQNSTVSNNIFYGRAPTFRTTLSNVIFNNNLVFGTFDNTMPPVGTGISGTANLTSADPLFINVAIQTRWSAGFDPNLDVSSPALGAGNDATDLGVFGSTIPFSVTGTPLPYIKQLLIPEIIKQGDDLNAIIEAVGN